MTRKASKYKKEQTKKKEGDERKNFTEESIKYFYKRVRNNKRTREKSKNEKEENIVLIPNSQFIKTSRNFAMKKTQSSKENCRVLIERMKGY